MLKTLLKKQFMEIFRSYFYDAKKNKRRSPVSTALFIVMFVLIMVAVLGGIFAVLSFAICGALVIAGMGWLYFTLMGLIAVLLGAFGSVFNTYSSLYLSKDNDMLLSMPIPVRYIMVSRLLSVYLMGLMYSAVVIVPAVIVYWIMACASPSAIIGSILLVILISVVVLVLSCLLGWVVAKISLKLKNKSFITVVISLLFIGLYYFFYYKSQELIEELIANAAVYGAKIKGAAYPLYLFGRVGEGDLFAMITVTAVVLVLFGLMWFMLSRSFIGIATSTGKTARVKYKETPVKVKSAFGALLGKEFRRFTSSPNYMLNCGLGGLFIVIIGALLLFKGGDIVDIFREVFVQNTGVIPVLFCAVVCLTASMNDTAAPSVSLEGKNMWLMHTLPVEPWQVLRAKLLVQLIITCIPTLICCACAAFVIPFTPLQLILSVIMVLLYVLLSAQFGLFLGLKLPNLTWTNEIAPIKQSACVMFSLFGGWIYSIAFGVVFLFIAPYICAELYLAMTAAITALLCVLLYLWLKKKGTRVFASL